MPETKIPFIEYLERVRGDERRGRAALAILRRGLGQEPGTSFEMLPLLAPWFPNAASRRQEDGLFLIASLFAWHPQEGGSGNLGDSFARVPDRDNSAIERRFAALLAAHEDDLDFYLRQAISFLRSKEVAVEWHQLYRDVLAWGRPDGSVQRRWARSFWGRAKEVESEESPANEGVEQAEEQSAVQG